MPSSDDVAPGINRYYENPRGFMVALVLVVVYMVAVQVGVDWLREHAGFLFFEWLRYR